MKKKEINKKNYYNIINKNKLKIKLIEKYFLKSLGLYIQKNININYFNNLLKYDFIYIGNIKKNIYLFLSLEYFTLKIKKYKVLKVENNKILTFNFLNNITTKKDIKRIIKIINIIEADKKIKNNKLFLYKYQLLKLKYDKIQQLHKTKSIKNKLKYFINKEVKKTK